jgi:integrase
MAEDAITDEVAEVNWVRGAKIRTNDPRATKPQREARVLTFEQMHSFVAAAGAHQALIRVFSDCGLRLGEVLGLERRDFEGDALLVRRSAHNSTFAPVTNPPRNTSGACHARRRQRSSCGTSRAPSTPRSLFRPRPDAAGGIATSIAMFGSPPKRPGGPRSKLGLRGTATPGSRTRQGCRPHDFRHSWVTHLRAAGIDPADLAAVAGHSVETATPRYTYALRRSHRLT